MNILGDSLAQGNYICLCGHLCVHVCVCVVRNVHKNACVPVCVRVYQIDIIRTSLAACLMNCLADCLQIAGTVITHCMSAALIGWSVIAISLSSVRHVSRKNLSA